MQLNKYLALCGISSRRKANLIIQAGRIAINGRTVGQLGEVVNAEDIVTMDGERLLPPDNYKYVLLNKPPDTITTLDDPRGRTTVVELIDPDVRLFPVGRLDYDTTGVLLLTNDGDLAYRLAHPRFEVVKIYHALVEGDFTVRDIRRFRSGVEIGERTPVAGEVLVLKKLKGRTLLEVRIHEGKKRQIKRMMAALHHPVVTLERVEFAGLYSGRLKPGQWRYLNRHEVEKLYKLVGLSQKNSDINLRRNENVKGESEKENGFIVTIDGPAGSGKSSTARRVAAALGWIVLDTGAMYRAIALRVVEKGISLTDTKSIAAVAEKAEIRFEPHAAGPRIFLDGNDVSRRIRHPDIDRAVGPVCEIAPVREVMVALQREAGRSGNIVAEGRDMGTVVFPDADVKIFMEASSLERARRRQKEQQKDGIDMELEEIQREIEARDLRDSSRQHSPLIKAEDAIVFDTTDCTLDDQVDFILERIREKLKQKN